MTASTYSGSVHFAMSQLQGSCSQASQQYGSVVEFQLEPLATGHQSRAVD